MTSALAVDPALVSQGSDSDYEYEYHDTETEVRLVD